VPPQRREIAVLELLLDSENPRLPEDLQGAEQAELLRYLSAEAVLDELIRSFADNGFFEHEPLIGYEEPDLGFIVLEGNRRLAALMVLLGLEEARELGLAPLLETPVPSDRLDELSIVPVYVVEDREDVHKYLGYRHIGGIKTWSAEAKARYLMREADRAAARRSRNPFLEVARRVGSNTQGVRNSYTAITLLRHAQDEFGIPVNFLVERRFGVWLRCMSAQDIRRYIGLDSGRSYSDVRAEIAETDEAGLREVIGDLSPTNGSRPLVNDSRDVTVYGRILHHDVAHEVLRKYRDFTIARQIVELSDLPERIDDLRERVDVARDEAQEADFSDALMEAAEGLFRAARSLRATVRELRLDEEDVE
jgi:hypothetical protein